MLTRILSVLTALLLCLCNMPDMAYAQQQEHPADTETIEVPLQDDPFAVFIYEQTMWLVAENSAHITLDALKKNNLRSVTHIAQIPSTQAEIFTFQLSGDYSATVEKPSETAINILLHQGIHKPSSILTPYISTGTDKQSSLAIILKNIRAPITVNEPMTGSDFLVVPTSEIGSGTYPTRSFAEFNLLQTVQGVVVQKKLDAVTVDTNKEVVKVSAPLGLKFSPSIVEQLSDLPEKEPEGKAKTLFPYQRWKLSDNKNFVATEMKLFHEIAYGDMDSSNKARLKLLEIYLGQGLFAEALGMSNDILRSSYQFYRTNNVAAMRGAAHFFLHHLERAERDFASPELADDKEAAMWRTLCHQELGDSSSVFDFPGNYERYISKYPPSFIQKLAIISANASINRKDFDTALNTFNIIVKSNLDEPIQRYIEYLRGKIYSETGNEDEAQRIWEKQSSYLDDPLIRASASFSLTNMLVREDRITTDKAITQLEKLLFVWRGDSLELNILTLLGNLYLEQKRYSDALHTFREIVRYFPESAGTINVAAKMESIFVYLYNKNGADSMLALDALALFYEFRDLVPSGRDGDMMIRNLSERLVKIDLLERAAELLNQQVQNRLQGSERSRVGARLAEIYLKNHQPDKALDTLKNTGYGDLPADVQLQRIRLTAKALAAEGHSDKAIEVLNSDNSPEGSMLRLSIYWNNKDWPNVTLTAEEILSNRNDPGAPLNIEESGVLLKLATAYVYEHDAGQIQYLRDYFTPLLKDNPDRQSFLFITSESGSTDYDNLPNIDQDIKTIKTFLADTRKQGKSDKLTP
ncbi:MAG TPA: tetratricopeptide repeat protein [Rickettsiales bacterium]|nr:tetratricopeptide repeat protein [Rickettsiales bacterium]